MTSKFRLLTEVNTPTVVGKSWWNKALKLSRGGDARRNAMFIIGAGAAFMVLPPLASAVFGDDDDDEVSTTTLRKSALDLQRQNGWSFGVADEARTLQFVGSVADPTFRQRFSRLTSDLAPSNPRHQSMFVPTLFQSLSESPPSAPSTEDAVHTGFVPLADVIQPVQTVAMANAAVDAKWLRSAFNARTGGFAVIVDLPGPEAVAFAAELADTFDPVFLFDNWPHPRGVVPAHMTLAAAVALQDRFAQAKLTRPTSAPPLFVLDRNRLAPYTDEANQFDNRSLARLPGAAGLQAIGVNRVLYVAPFNGRVIDSDDVNEDLLFYGASGLDVRAVQLADYYLAGSADAAADLFASRYGLPQTPPPPPAAPTLSSLWVPTPRASAFSGGQQASMAPSHPRPAGFGEVPVVINAASGLMMGALLYRAGSWNQRSGSSNRTSSSSWSFGGG